MGPRNLAHEARRETRSARLLLREPLITQKMYDF